MMLAKHKPILVLSLLIVAVSFVMAPVYAAQPPDTFQVFGVGTRADAMGDAFVAVADDPSATFWNPAGLTLMPNRQFAVVGKTLPAVNQSASFANLNESEYASLDLFDTFGKTSSSSDGAEATFFAATMPLGTGGVVGISHALTGYSNQRMGLSGTFDYTPGLGEMTALDFRAHYVSRIDQTAITYGWRPSEMLRAGFGVVAARAEFDYNVTQSITYSNEDPEGELSEVLETSSSANSLDSDGTGYGVTLGTLWTPRISKSMDWTLGASYQSKMSFSDLTSQFGDEMGDRLLVGASCKGEPVDGRQSLWAFQFSRYGSSNSDNDGQAARSSVWDFYFGGQYGTSSQAAATAHRYYQARYGMFTNKSPNKNYYGSETWLTLGLGTGSGANAWQAEFAFQHALQSSLSLLSLSGDYRF